MNAAFALIARDVRLAWRHPNEIATILAFFVIAASLFPFGIGPEPQILARVAIGIVWVTALLACLMSLDRLFQAEAEMARSTCWSAPPPRSSCSPWPRSRRNGSPRRCR